MFRNLKPGEKATLRDSKGRPLYLSKLPFYKRHPRLFAGVGAVMTFIAVTSGFWYNTFIRDNSNLTVEETLWPSEIARGKTNRQRLLEKYCPEEYAKELKELESGKKVGFRIPTPTS